MKTNTDVLIAGAGPTGSILAIDLLRRGLKVRLIEKNAQSFPGSRAKGLQPRTLEMLHDLGALDPILAGGGLYPPLGVHIGPFTLPRRMYKNVSPTADKPYPNTWLIPQYTTDAKLHERFVELGGRVEFGTQLESFKQDGSKVTASVKGPNGIEQIECGYLVGTDGGASTVREALKIGFPGKTDESDKMVIVDSKVDGLSRNYWHAWPGKKGRFTVACPLPGGDLFQWMIQLQPGEEPNLDEAALNEMILRRTKSRKIRIHDIQWTSIFRPNIRLADEYRVGRIFVAGDAAHVHTPMGAQGLNTGVQDAYNLGWKIAQVIHGAPDSLLETYEAERQPIAASVLGRSTKKYEAAAKNDAESRKRGKDEQQLLITYRSGPLGRQGTHSTRTLDVGDRAPDALLKRSDGSELRLFELFRGPHFTAIAVGKGAIQALQNMKWPDKGDPLLRVSLDGDSAASLDEQVEDLNGSFREVYGVKDDALFLIRPDGYVGQIALMDFAQKAESFVRMVAPS